MTTVSKVVRVLVILAAALGASVATGQQPVDAAGKQSDNAAVALQRAIRVELVDGDLETAIALYEQVAERYADERPVAAEALLRLGACYEKLGDPGATTAYERVISDYRDRAEIVTEALVRMRSLNGETAVSLSGQELVARRVLQAGVVGNPSPDGRYFSDTDWSTGDLAIRDLSDKSMRRVTNVGYPEMAQESVFSRDGEQIAYSWYTADGDNQLRVVNRDGTGVRVVYTSPNVAYVRPDAWSAEGDSILVTLYPRSEAAQMAMVSVADGRMTAITDVQQGEPIPVPDLSPDGRYVTYAHITGEGANGARDIFVVPATGGPARPLVSSAADDHAPIWSPDGNLVLFLSNRGGGYDLWAQQVADGSPRGVPRLVQSGIGDVLLHGLTDDGSLHYSSWAELYDLRQASYDAASGRLTPLEPGSLTTRPGLNRFPGWSPGGERIAYVHRAPGAARREHSLIVQTVATGDQAEFDLGRWNLARVRGWSPDGNRILLTAWGEQEQGVGHGLYWIDVRTGDVELIAQAADSGGGFAGAQLSPDGGIVYLPREGGIVARDLETGEQRPLGPSQGYGASPFGFAVSPDGAMLAFQVNDRFPLGAVMVMDSQGGEAREVYPAGGFLRGLAFTPDGRYLLALIEEGNAPGDSGGEDAFAFWRIPIDGGEPERAGLTLGIDNKLSAITFHPDGRTLAYIDGHAVGEVWVLENLLAEMAAFR